MEGISYVYRFNLLGEPAGRFRPWKFDLIAPRDTYHTPLRARRQAQRIRNSKTRSRFALSGGAFSALPSQPYLF